MKSIWNEMSKSESFPTLGSDRETDIAIIGGGMAGILIAYFLQSAGKKVMVLEREKVGGGQTKNTTAKITSQHGLFYDQCIQDFGFDKARLYAKANELAILHYEQIIQQHAIECDFTRCPSYLYSQHEAASLHREAMAAEKLGIDAAFTTETELPFDVRGAVKFERQARFHPLKFLHAIAKQVNIVEYTPVTKVEDHVITTPKAKVTANKIIFACHYPFINTPGYYFMRMHQERSYVLALKNAPVYDGMYYGIDKRDGYSFRSYQDMLLLGGGNHRTGDNKQGGKFSQLRKAAAKLYPDSQEVTCWSAQDCITLDNIPYIGQFSAATPHWYVATGFKKWGMTSSMVSAMLLRDLLIEGKSEFETVFTPKRFVFNASAKTLMEESGQAIKGLSKEFLQFPSVLADDLAPGHGGIVEFDGKKVGVYKDPDGTVFALSTRCPHLGCQLEWNPDEQSWDCPCHGSRFDAAGNVIDGPAQRSLRHE